MSIKLIRIEESGSLDGERLVLQATADTSIGKYIILQTRKSPDGKVFSGYIPSSYWLVSMDVKSGDLIVLYTKNGQTSQKLNETSSSTSYFFYWGLDHPIWNTNCKPTVVTASTWDWSI